MFGDKELHLRIRVSVPGQPENVKADRRESFWSRVRERPHIQSSYEPSSTSEIEAALLREFGRHLHDFLVKHFHSAWQGPDARGMSSLDQFQATYPVPAAAALLPLVFFEARVLGYSSLSLGVEIAGVKQLAELFDGNYDTFMMFLRQYVPLAFSYAAQPFSTGDLCFEIAVGPGLREEFVRDVRSHSGNAVSRGSAMEMPAKAYSFWLIANASLVVPVLLALVILYIAARTVSEEHRQLSDFRESILAREQGIVATHSKRVAELEALSLELFNTLRSSPTPSTAK